MFANESSGLVGGIGLIVTALGFVVTLWALRVTYRQLVRTKTAAEAVSENTNRMKGRTSFFDIAIETLKASKSLENALSHVKARSWRFASESLWDAQVSLNRTLSDLPDHADRVSTEAAVRGFNAYMRELDEAAEKNTGMDTSGLSDLIRQQIISVEKRLVALQRDVYDK